MSLKKVYYEQKVCSCKSNWPLASVNYRARLKSLKRKSNMAGGAVSRQNKMAYSYVGRMRMKIDVSDKRCSSLTRNYL